MKNIVIITSNSIRHNYFKIMFGLSKEINILRTYVESNTQFYLKKTSFKNENFTQPSSLHFKIRDAVEYDFFSDIIEYSKDNSNSQVIQQGAINNSEILEEIIKLNPDLIITYGCSIIKEPLLNAFKNRIINVHLGLSPYYFGSGTNFHCLVNNEFYCEGYTFMYMDKGIDTGEIIHQSRAEIIPFDNPHQIGNRLIKQMTKEFIYLIKNFEKVKKIKPIQYKKGKTYKNSDATETLTKKLYEIFDKGAVIKYLSEKEDFSLNYPLVKQPFLKELND